MNKRVSDTHFLGLPEVLGHLGVYDAILEQHLHTERLRSLGPLLCAPLVGPSGI